MLKILATATLAIMLAFNLGGASPAFAGYIFHKKLVTGDHQYTSYDDEGNKTSVITYDENHKLLSEYYYNLGNPQPDGTSTGEIDVKAVIEEAMKNGGAELVKENNFLETTLGQTLIKHSNTGSIIPYHNPVPIDSSVNPGTGASNPAANGLSEDPLGDKTFEQEKNPGSMGGGWYDPMGGSMVEQMIKAGKKNKGKDNKGSGDAASDAHDPGYDFPADPALVNPVPESLSAAKPGKTKVKQVTAPALIKKAKGPVGNLFKYPDVPNLPGPAAATNQNNRSGFNTGLGKQPGAASGNFQTPLLGRGGARR